MAVAATGIKLETKNALTQGVLPTRPTHALYDDLRAFQLSEAAAIQTNPAGSNGAGTDDDAPPPAATCANTTRFGEKGCVPVRPEGTSQRPMPT